MKRGPRRVCESWCPLLLQVRDKMRLRVNIVRAPNRSLRDYQPDIPFHTLQSYKFQQMLLSVVEAPEPVLCYFCQYRGLHHIPIAGNLRPDEITRITNELPKLRFFFTANLKVSGADPVCVTIVEVYYCWGHGGGGRGESSLCDPFGPPGLFVTGWGKPTH